MLRHHRLAFYNSDATADVHKDLMENVNTESQNVFYTVNLFMPVSLGDRGGGVIGQWNKGMKAPLGSYSDARLKLVTPRLH